LSIQVSVLCLTFNHGKYIRKALESMLAQKTNFDYEILIHDDASTDDTQKIIKEFQNKYPHIVKPIFQKENQYKKGVKVQAVYNYPRIKGKYVAFCEGDDYWIDNNKLQKQVDYMESHPECTLCIHNALRVDTNGQLLSEIKTVETSRTVTCEEVILGGGGFCATNSIMAPAALIINRPDYFNICSMDYVYQMYFASCGEIYCFADDMSAYRVGVEGSWTDRMRKKPEMLLKNSERHKAVKCEFDKSTNYKYHDVIEETIICSEYQAFYKNAQFKKLIKEPYKSCTYSKRLPLKNKLMIYLGAFFPVGNLIIQKIRKGRRKKSEKSNCNN